MTQVYDRGSVLSPTKTQYEIGLAGPDGTVTMVYDENANLILDPGERMDGPMPRDKVMDVLAQVRKSYSSK